MSRNYVAFFGAKFERINDKSPVLDYILPILQLAVVNSIAKEAPNKDSVLIAGKDEHEQWDQITRTVGLGKLAAILIPELKISTNENINQDTDDDRFKKIVECISESDITSNFEVGNVSNWMYRMFFALEHYRDESIDRTIFSGDCEDIFTTWKDKEKFDKTLKKEELISHIWEKIENSKVT